MRTKIAMAIANEYKDGKPLSLDGLKSIIRISFEISGLDWTEEDFQWVIEDVLYRLHGE